MADSNASVNTTTIAITVELPQHERSFRVVVSPGACVRDLKDAIAQECDGRPRAEGQRLIAKGRVLADGDLVEELWKGDDARVVHLAVSPWAWTEGIPSASLATSPSSGDDINHNINTGNSSNNINNTRIPLINNTARPPTFSSTADITQYIRNTSSIAEAQATMYEYPDPPPYLMHLHYRALRALSPTTPAPARAMSDTAEAKETAIAATHQAGMAWPADVLDAEYPPPGEEGEGVKYRFTKIGSLPYLQNLTPNATPTPRQQHALKVLSYTFPLLSGTRLNDAISGAHIERRLRSIQHRLDAAMRRLGGGDRRGVGVGLNFGGGVGAAPNVNGFHAQLQVRIPIRALLMSFVFLAFRVLLLMYFFSPARKPLFSLLVGVWVLYEAWGVIRVAFEDADPLARRAAGVAGREAGAGNGVPPGAPGQAAAGGAAGAPNGGDPQQQVPHQLPQAAPAQAQPNNLSPDYILSRLARLHLAEEDQYLDPRPSRSGPAPADTAEPGWFFKARLFVTLFVLTLHPAFWNRRRVLLTAREAKIRTESHARESAEEAERDAQQFLQRRQEEAERRREAGVGEGNGEAPAPTPTTVEERALQARRVALQQIVERDGRRPIWVREYVKRVLRDSWADE